MEEKLTCAFMGILTLFACVLPVEGRYFTFFPLFSSVLGDGGFFRSALPWALKTLIKNTVAVASMWLAKGVLRNFPGCSACVSCKEVVNC